MDLFFSDDIRRPGARHGLPAAIALVAILFSLFASTALGGEISPALRDRMAAAPSDEATIPVIVTLTAQVDADNFEGRRPALMAAMKRVAAGRSTGRELGRAPVASLKASV